MTRISLIMGIGMPMQIGISVGSSLITRLRRRRSPRSSAASCATSCLLCGTGSLNVTTRQITLL